MARAKVRKKKAVKRSAVNSDKPSVAETKKHEALSALFTSVRRCTTPRWAGLVNQYGPLKSGLDDVRARLAEYDEVCGVVAGADGEERSS